MRARVKIPEKMAAWIPVGQQVAIRVEAYLDRTFTGKISRVNPSVDPLTRTFDAEALIDNREGLLKPGFFAKASIVSNKVEDAVFVPQKALSYAYGIYKLYVVQGSTLKAKEVKLGDRVGDDVEIVEGVSSGERLALPASDQELRDGVAIRVTSMAENEATNANAVPSHTATP
jgi:RND family efflux transporter MFP subunit